MVIYNERWQLLSDQKQYNIIMLLRKNPRCLVGCQTIKDILDEVNPRVMASDQRLLYWFHPSDIETLSLRFKIENQTYLTARQDDIAFA